MRTLVISPCSAKKRGDVPDPALAADLAEPERQRLAEARLAAFACPAIEMYTGTHHRLVVAGVHAVWDSWGRHVLDLSILSGGYGLLAADQVIIPYDVTLDQFEDVEYAAWVARLEIPRRAAMLVREYDLVFYLLDGRYLTSLGLPLDVPGSVQQIVFTDQESFDQVSQTADLHPVLAAGGVAARRWHVKAPHVRGFLFRRLCDQVVQHGPAVLEWLRDSPQDTELLFYKQARWRPQLALW
jgi:hypothetical protein